MEFNISKLSEITMNINRGVTPSYTEEGNCYVINQRCIRDNSIDLSLARKNDIKLRSINEDKLIKIGDTLINSTGVGTLGRVARVKKIKGILTCDSHVMIVRPNKNKIDPVYLSYYLFGMQSVIENMGRGSTGQTELSRIELGELEIKYPSYKEQIKIAKILSSIDDKIELNNKINNNLEDLAQTLYKHWFVDFEFPNEEGLPYKSSGGKMVESELGLIPKGWSVIKLNDIIDYSNGYAFKSKDYEETGKYKVITIRNVKDGKFDLSNVSKVPKIPERIREDQILNIGD